MEALFGKVVETLGGGASLEEVCCLGRALKLTSLALLPFPLHSECGCCVTSSLPDPATTASALACCYVLFARMGCIYLEL